MNTEVQAFIDKATVMFLTRDEIPPGRKPIPCMAKLSVKYKNGVVERRKCRIVASGQKEEFLLDFMDTHAPTPMYISVHMLLIVAETMGLKTFTMDVQTAFLNSEIKDYDIYVELPHGVGFPEVFGKLLKSIYGLKQAARDWHVELHKLLVELGLTASAADPSLYYAFLPDGVLVLMAIFVDDVLTCTNSVSFYKRFIKEFNKRFACKDLGELDQYIGIEVRRDEFGALLSRVHSIDKLAEKFASENRNLHKYPITKDIQLTRAMSFDRKVQYRELYGSLLFEKRTWRPDIAYAMAYYGNFVGHFQQEHFDGLLKTLLYLKRTQHVTLKYTADPRLESMGDMLLEMYTDASFGDKNATEWQSTSGWVIKLNGNTLTAGSKREKFTAISTQESELIAVYRGLRDMMGALWVLSSLQLKVQLPMTVYVDNMPTINLIKNKVCNSESKHIDIKYFWSRQLVQRGLVDVKWVRSENNLADLMTKPLVGAQFVKLRNLVMGHAEDAFA